MATAHLRPSARRGACALAALLVAAGCQSDGPLARWRMARDSGIAKGPTRDELGNDAGLMSRWLSPRTKDGDGKARRDPAAPGALVKPAPDPEAEAEFDAAEKLFQQGKLDEAEAELARIAKKRKETPWGEKAQYYLAEARFQRGNYVGAHDAYEALLATYPGTNYLDKAVAREYAIAQAWLAAIDPKAKPEQRPTWPGRFAGRFPLVDTGGTALTALEHVRHHDPSGPLADDAVMRIADYHFANGDYEDAALYYDQLIAEHPKSPMLQRAQLSSIDAKIRGYLGPDYDGAGLEQAAETIKQTQATFPERAASTADALYRKRDLIEDQKAERTYHVGEFYRRTGHYTSAELYFGEVRARWPKSQWAEKAKVQLASLAKKPRKQTLPSKIMTLPGSPDPYSNGVGSANPNGMMGAGGMPMGGAGAGPY
jgi:outer membrane assembly lipoprotein YfiO